MNIELLQGSFPITENPGLDSTDPRFDEISTLIQAGQYTEAASLSETIIADDIYDIRLISYLCYGYWLEHDLTSLGEIIHCLNNIFQENWEAIGPANKREKNVQNSLGWLFRQILKKVQYEESKNTDQWQYWQASVSTDQIGDILDLGTIFRHAISQQLEDNAGAIIDLWSKIEEWLHALQRLVYRVPEPEPVETESEDTVVSSTENTAKPAKTAGLEVETSYHMGLLLTKLAAFEQLLEQEKFPRAALVADDINETLANFDPKLYFPKFFQTFARLQALNFEELSVYAEQRDYPEWQAMQEWFKVDIDGFINS